MKHPKVIKRKRYLILKGITMGAANKVPGVSGGIVALVFGFYEEFVESLKKIDRDGVSMLLKGQFSDFFKHVNGKFLCLLFTGMLISYFSVSKFLDYLIYNYEVYVWSLFFGMIIGSVIYIYKNFKSWELKTLICACFGILLGISLSFISPLTQNENLWFVFFCGMVSITGMTIPGFSGSFVLMLLGNYVLLLVDAVNALFDTVLGLFSGNFAIISDPYTLKMLKILMVFTLGSLVGLVVISHLLNFVLKRFKNTILGLIMGFICGSLGVVWPWKKTIYRINHTGDYLLDSNGDKRIENYQRFFPEFSYETFLALFLIALGVGLVLGLNWYGKLQKKRL